MNIDEHKQPNYIGLHTLIFLTTCVCFIFVFINFFEHREILSALELFICIINIILLISFKKIIQSRFADKFVISYSCSLLLAITLLFSFTKINTLSYIWIFLIPCIGYVVNGIRLGFRLTTIFNSLTFTLYLLNNYWEYEQFSLTQFSNIMFSAVVAWIIIHRNEAIKNKMNKKLAKLAISDPLTKLKNREELYKTYHQYSDTMMSIAIINIDCIKDINNKYGYLAGDVVLINVANLVMENKKLDADAFRIGDDEYAILRPNSDAEACLTAVRDLYAKIVQQRIVLKDTVIDDAKISIALTSIKSDGNNLDDLLKKANALLQQARNSKTDKFAVSL